MEIRIGVQNVAREIVVDTEESAEDVAAKVSAALSSQGELSLRNTKGSLVIVPGAHIGYVEIGADQARPVGFAVN